MISPAKLTPVETILSKVIGTIMSAAGGVDFQKEFPLPFTGGKRVCLTGYKGTLTAIEFLQSKGTAIDQFDEKFHLTEPCKGPFGLSSELCDLDTEAPFSYMPKVVQVQEPAVLVISGTNLEAVDLVKPVATIATATKEQAHKHSKHILIVDDSIENRKAASKVFPDATVVNSAKEAIKLLKSNPLSFPIVITDIDMETPAAGAEVFAFAVGTGREVLAVTGGGMNHGSQVVEIQPLGLHLDRLFAPDALVGKAGLAPWEACKSLLEGKDISLDVYKGKDYFKQHPDRGAFCAEKLKKATAYYTRFKASVTRGGIKQEPVPDIGDISVRVFLFPIIASRGKESLEDLRRLMGNMPKSKVSKLAIAANIAMDM